MRLWFSGLWLVLWLVFTPVSTSGCAKASPTLSPSATAAFYGTQVIQSLDLLRDTAITANAQIPPLVTTTTTRQVVQTHRSALQIIHAAPNGYTDTVLAGIDELSKHMKFEDRQRLAPYMHLVKALIHEVQR